MPSDRDLISAVKTALTELGGNAKTREVVERVGPGHSRSAVLMALSKIRMESQIGVSMDAEAPIAQSDVSLDQVLAVKVLADDLGGIAKIRECLKILDYLRS